MGMDSSALILLTVLVTTSVQGFIWHKSKTQLIYALEGDEVRFVWQYALEANDSLTTMRWFKGNYSDKSAESVENIALYDFSLNAFKVSAPYADDKMTFDGRHANISSVLVIKDVMTSDAGVYSCHVDGIERDAESVLTVLPKTAGIRQTGGRHKPTHDPEDSRLGLISVIILALGILLALVVVSVWAYRHKSTKRPSETFMMLYPIPW